MQEYLIWQVLFTVIHFGNQKLLAILSWKIHLTVFADQDVTVTGSKYLLARTLRNAVW